MNRDRTISFKEGYKIRYIIILCYSKSPWMNFIYQVIKSTLTVTPYYRAIVNLGKYKRIHQQSLFTLI